MMGSVKVDLFKQRGEKLRRLRPDLHAAFPDGDSSEFWAWCHCYGILEDADLASFAPPLPPEDLRYLAGGSAAPDEYLLEGSKLFLAIDKLVDLKNSKAILDFGCGSGRLLRFLSRYARHADMVGVDIEPRHMQWAASNLEFATFTIARKLPPLLMTDQRFDTAVALSVFSHLPEDSHMCWMKELARIVAPGGLVIVSTLGQGAIDAALANARYFAELDITEKEFKNAQREFGEKGFSFVLQATHSLPDYGIALASKEWIERFWGEHFEVVTHIPRWLMSFQDGYLLRRR